ncbi:hypothetical protein LCGC14_3006330 [marine sediment metagenome]|uniref:Uncharacterized protein n=1 Tax=marine sediment metagenome TaxID=412755 RepID=A0A0F8XM87_9ZZZZ
MMTVAELIKRLQEMEPESLVVMATDEEGNGFAPLGEIELGAYEDGEIKLAELTDELRKQGYGEEDVSVDGVRAVVLWP